MPKSNYPAISTEAEAIGLIIVDHGSLRRESNDLLLEVVEAYRGQSGWRIVEPAHMELAQPSIATAFARCVEQGAKLVAVFPYFLGPGRHWSEDIPRLAAEAAKPHVERGVRHLVTAPLGLHPLLLEVIGQRVEHCLERVAARAEACDVCAPGGGCALLPPLASDAK
jgi:sirohydrochlorin ferrochelatase